MTVFYSSFANCVPLEIKSLCEISSLQEFAQGYKVHVNAVWLRGLGTSVGY